MRALLLAMILAATASSATAFAQNQKKAGKSVDDASAAYKVPDRFKGYTAQAARVKSDFQVIYDEIDKKK